MVAAAAAAAVTAALDEGDDAVGASVTMMAVDACGLSTRSLSSCLACSAVMSVAVCASCETDEPDTAGPRVMITRGVDEVGDEGSTGACVGDAGAAIMML